MPVSTADIAWSNAREAQLKIRDQEARLERIEDAIVALSDAVGPDWVQQRVREILLDEDPKGGAR